jgi:hypothetical protein
VNNMSVWYILVLSRIRSVNCLLSEFLEVSAVMQFNIFTTNLFLILDSLSPSSLSLLSLPPSLPLSLSLSF